jgi:ankyrin repeat protein
VASGRQADQQGLTRPLIDLFLERGAALDQNGTGGLLWITLCHTVENQGQRDIARYLVSRGHPVDLPFAAGVGDLDHVRGHLERGGPGPHADRYYRHHRASGPEATPDEVVQDALLFAVVNNHPDVVEHLLDHGARLDRSRPWAREVVTPLHAAAWAGWPEMARTLLDRGAEPTVRDPRHAATAVGWASHMGRAEVLEVFRDHPDRLDLLDALELGLVDRVRTALGEVHPDLTVGRGGPGALLRSAAFLGHRDVVTLLLDGGADPSLRDPQGRSAVDSAEAGGHPALAEFLRRHGAA